MKNIEFYKILICFGLLWLTYSCEKADLQKSTIKDIDHISSRVDECENCPNVNDCCCGVELQDPDDAAFLRLCGTTDGQLTCNDTAPITCPAINGGGQIIQLDSDSPKSLFCMAQGSTFAIRNTSSIDPAVIQFTCQNDVAHPQIIYITIPTLTTYYFATNSSCQVGHCG
ncbi:MAG TPA: hypothetical protein VN763_12255 [Saprospiraceae bacterium]|nr:hypothetical protein [Saprospiraceae bacterium]